MKAKGTKAGRSLPWHAGLIGLALFGRLIAESWPGLALSHLAPGFWVALSVVFTAFSLRRIGWPTVVHLGMSLLTATFLGGWVWRIPTASPKNALRVMSYNVEQGFGGVSELAKAIRSVNPDIVCFQEMNPETYRGLQSALPEYRWSRTIWLATATRLPIERQVVTPMTTSPDRHLLRTDIQLDGQTISVFTCHLTALTLVRAPSWPERLLKWQEEQRTQIRVLTRELAACPNPALALGDFNLGPWSPTLRPLHQRMRDTFAEAGSGFGYTMNSSIPNDRIDYVWADPTFRPTRSWVPVLRASDHRPVVTDFALAP